MPRRQRLTPIPPDFFFADPVRSNLDPLLCMALVYAYQWSELIGSNGFLTEPQLHAALGQISAHGYTIATVIQDLLEASQLDDVGTGFQLPQTHTFQKRRAHAVAEKERYHRKRGGSKRRVQAVQRPVPVAKTPRRDPDRYRSRVTPMPAQTVDEVCTIDVPKERAEPLPTSSSASALFDMPEGHTRPVPPQSRGSGSGTPPLAEQTVAEQSQARTCETETKAPSAAPIIVGSRVETYQLSADSREVLQEVMTRIGVPVSDWPADQRGVECPRASYGPPPWLIARWVDVMPIEQILSDYQRYIDKGDRDITAVREHDSRFESFMKSTMSFKHEKMTRRVIAQREMRMSLKRQAAQNNHFYDNYDWSNFGTTHEEYAKRNPGAQVKKTPEEIERTKRVQARIEEGREYIRLRQEAQRKQEAEATHAA